MGDFLRQLEGLETDAEQKNLATLLPFLKISEQLINIVPTITKVTQRQTFDMTSMIQHVFLKQSLTCLRAANKLLVAGYTAQAAMIVCSMYEIDLYSTYIGNDTTRGEKYRRHDNSQDWVWPPHFIIKELAENNLRRQGVTIDQKTLSSAKQDVDGAYVFLCSIKHPNPIPMLRHTATTNLDNFESDKATYRFGIFPDSREEDEIVKKVILSEANQRAISVAQNTANTAPELSERQAKWLNELLEIQSRQVEIYQQLANPNSKMPFPTIRRIDAKSTKSASKT